MATSLTNIDQWLSGGFRRAQYVLSSSGRPYGTAPAADSGAGMSILQGAKTANISLPQPTILQIPGDDGVRGTIQFPGNELPSFDLVFSDFKGSFLDAVQGTTADDAQSIYDFFMLDPANRSFPDIFLMLTQRAPSTLAGEQGNGYATLVFPLCTLGFSGLPQLASGANAGEYTFTVTLNRVSILPWGEVLTTGAHGTDGASGFYFFSEEIPTFDVFRQNNSTATYTPTQDLNANDQVIAYDSALDGAGVALAITPSSGDFTFTAQTSGNLTTFLYEVA